MRHRNDRVAARGKSFIDLDQIMKNKRLDYLMIFRRVAPEELLRHN
jgi:hypothetical protein